jgi:hypothetical protein
MWSRLREAVVGMAEQAGIEVPGLDAAATAVTDLGATAGDAASAVVAQAETADLLGSATDVASSGAPAELITGATDAAAGAGEAVSGVVGEAATTASGVLDALKGGLAP